ncbi:MAG: WecB/TagA/CpsF family glycosyltransferase [Anaerolineaceae bacterium]|nr:WecB/TagA/CpsF family glycosyltransferase [Anaerolineaceae bacterium]
MTFPRENILGIAVNAINMQQAIGQIESWVIRKESAYICVTPAHAIMECVNQPELKKIYNESSMTTPDGMAIVWLLKLADHKQITRVYGPDLLLQTCSAFVDRDVKHFFYGGAPHVAEKLVQKLRAINPQVKIAGSYSPPFRALSEEEDATVIKMFKDSGADIIWIGLGSPKQEQWMANHYNQCNAVMIGVGAAFDFLSGTKKQAPYWIQRSGFEWLFRLFSEPKRLWRRYIKYPKFIWLVIMQKLKIQDFPIED